MVNTIVCVWLARGFSERAHVLVEFYCFHAVSDRLEGPFKIQNSVGKGHNPEAFRLKDGRVVVYVIDGYYIADGVDSKVWTYGKFSFDSRDRKS